MTKTEFKKRLIALAIEQLENEFGVEFTGDDEGGRLGFMVGELQGDFSRRDLSVAFWDSIGLHRPEEFPIEVVKRHQQAVALENQINEALEAFHMNKDNW
jgi:predicted DNA-binding protein (MmcQ/YjbR family)